MKRLRFGILQFNFDDTHPDQLIHRVKLIEVESGQVFNKNLVYVYIETPKFNKKEEELNTRLDQWLFVLTGMSKFTEIPLTLQEDEIFKQFFMTAEVANLKLAEYMEYVASQKEQWDKYAVETTAEARGREEGLEKGREEKNTVFVTNLLQKTKHSVEEIAGLAEVSVAFVRSVKKRLDSE